MASTLGTVGWTGARRAVWMAATALALAGCGGGDGDAGAAPAGLQAMPAMKAIQVTGRALDVAIEGEGAFVLRDPRTGTQLLSRLGHFDIDAQGRLVNDEGWWVEGAVDAQATSSLERLAPLAAVPATLPPVATRTVVFEANLDARLTEDSRREPVLSRFAYADPTTYRNATVFSIHDAAGQAVMLTLYFRVIGLSAWAIHATANGLPIPADVAGEPQPLLSLNFRPNGSAAIDPADPRQDLRQHVFDIPPTVGADGTRTLALPGLRLDLSRLTQYPVSFAVTTHSQDGSPTEPLTAATVLPTGELALTYGQARTDTSRRLMLARTTVADRLSPYGASGWVCGRGCLSPVVTQPGQLLTGKLSAGALNTGP